LGGCHTPDTPPGRATPADCVNQTAVYAYVYYCKHFRV
jgi:hypothetical protein